MKVIKTLLYFTILLILLSCKSQKIGSSSARLNTIFNSEYRNSMLSFSGILGNDDYEQIRNEIESELELLIPKDKAIIIHFLQRARNCITMNNNGDYYLFNVNRGTEIYSKISSNNNALVFFVYTEDVFFVEQISGMKNYKCDSGFFQNKIFNNNNICNGIFILKPNKKFLKLYCEDTSPEITSFLKN
jgi:hypothetical protein